ncbi:MAG: toll/interleukin-1 receptor domain-containing protein [Gloeobacteraceae cyanobacterium ES-bin-144]|nr:toll/interleukin-1 receptor domain-containing protein [Verrucomicrobiales bacterium]
MGGQNYWAFISYSSKDAAFVKKLHARLETYRMPRDLVGRPGLDEPIPKKLFPVFRDRDELPLASNLGSTIQDALKASRYLIVVCSPNSASSQWVNEEIRYYKSIGRENRILAVIIDGEPNATNMKDPIAPECFPEALRFHVDPDGTISDRPTEPIAGDLRPGKDGWNLAFLKCIAGITGCGLNALTEREKKRARRRKIINSLAVLAVSAGVIGWWDYTRTKIEYYANTVDHFGIPEGYYELSKVEVAHREKSYRIESSRRKVRKISCIHSSGSLVDRGEFDSATQHIEFSEDGSIREIEFRNKNQRITARRLFSTIKNGSRIIEFKNEHNDSPLALSAANLSMSAGASELMRSEVTAERASYNADGSLAEIRYLSSWREPRADPDGIFGQKYVYEKSPFPSQIINLDADGNPVKNRKGFSSARFERDRMGSQSKVSLYDENDKPVTDPDGWHAFVRKTDAYGNVISKSLLNDTLHPVDVVKGFYETRYTYSESGDCINTAFFNKDLNPVVTTDGYAEQRDTYDDKGFVLTTSWYFMDGAPASDENGVHNEVSVRDQYGNQTELAYFDTAKKPCLSGTNKVHLGRFTYDAKGQLSSIANFDVNDKPMTMSEGGYHLIKFSWDDLGRMKSWSYYDVNGQVKKAGDGESMTRMKYDRRGNIAEYASFDENGNPCSGDLIHRVAFTYDERGLEVRRENFGVSGQPINGSDEIHRRETKYNAAGKKSEVAYHAANGSAAADSSGVHRYAYVSDSKGNILEEAYFDKDNRPTIASSNGRNNGPGAHLVRKKFNHAGKAVETEFFDREGKPYVCEDGYHRTVCEYDNRGNETRIYYFLPDGVAAIHRVKKAHSEKTSYDERNRIIALEYFDSQGKPCNGNEGWHLRKCAYDRRYNLLTRSYYNFENQPCLGPTGWHRMDFRYNSSNDVIEKTCFGLDGKPDLCEAGWHRFLVTTSDDGNVEESFYFGKSNEPIIHLSYKWHRQTVRKSADGSTKESAIFGPGGEPIADKDGIHKFISEYANGNETARSFFNSEGKPHYLRGICRWEKKFNSRNQAIEMRWFDENHKPVPNGDGVHLQTMRYNDEGKIEEYANFGTDEKPITDQYGNHRWKQEVDAHDRVVFNAFLDSNGQPIRDKDGIYQLRREYDEAGNISKCVYFGAEGKPDLHPSGNHGYLSKYDGRREIERTWIDTAGKPVALEDEIAKWTAVYDGAGREVERRFFDSDLKPTIGNGKFHLRRSTYDADGQETSRAFFGIDDHAAFIDGGFHRWEVKYNNSGKVLEKAFFDKDQKPILHQDGNHRFVNTYDDHGNCTSTRYFGTTGEPVFWKNDFHHSVVQYDANNREISSEYFGLADEPINKEDGYHKLETSYDSNGRITSFTFSDSKGLMPKKFKFRSLNLTYHPGSVVIASKTWMDSEGEILNSERYDEKGNVVH